MLFVCSAEKVIGFKVAIKKKKPSDWIRRDRKGENQWISRSSLFCSILSSNLKIKRPPFPLPLSLKQFGRVSGEYWPDAADGLSSGQLQYAGQESGTYEG